MHNCRLSILQKSRNNGFHSMIAARAHPPGRPAIHVSDI
jgi:hypothetical protein